MEFILGLALAFTASMLFWPALVIVFFILAFALDSEELPGTLFLSSVAMAGMLFVKWGMDLSITWSGAGIAIAGYLLLGTAWSFIKWFMKLRKARTQFISSRDQYLRDHKLATHYFKEVPETDEQKKHHIGFAHALSKKTGFRRAQYAETAQEALEQIKPLVGDHKGSITLWIGYWPASVIAFLFNDLLKEVFETIYATISEWFQQMSNRMFKDLV